MQILFIFLNCLKHVLLFYFFKQCFTVDLFEAGFKVYILHLFYMCVKPFKVCNSSFFMFSCHLFAEGNVLKTANIPNLAVCILMVLFNMFLYL